MSGTGKSTLLHVLAERGHLTVDTDYDGWTLDDGRWDATRVSSRTTNPYGQTADEQAEIAHYVRTVEPLLRRTATVELDGQASVSELACAVEELTWVQLV
jgi:hypothetical protein